MVYHLIFSFPKLLFIEYHTIISEVCFNNREFHSSILGVILNFLSTFGGTVYFIEFLSTMFRNLSIVSLFWGGTCLRIFHGLQRFSEDMDFYKITQNI